MTIKLLSPEESRLFEEKFITTYAKKRKYDWDNMSVGQGFAISKTEMPSVNYSGPTLPDDLYEPAAYRQFHKYGPYEPD